jgi:phospholipase C
MSEQPSYYGVQLTLVRSRVRFTRGDSFHVPFPVRALVLVFSGALIASGCGGNTRAASPLVSLSLTVTGNGTVTSNPPGINCPSTCTANFASGSSVSLTATAASGSVFSGYGGACSGTSCTLVLQNNQTVSAAFSASSQVTVSISGSGTVTSNPSGINCPATCTASFSSGSSVSLAATPSAGFKFSGFSGACSGTSCQLTVATGQNLSVTATFSGQNLNAINHIVVLLQENRSLDHYFSQLPAYWQAHGFPQATNGTTFDAEPATAANVDPNGNMVTAYNLQSGCTENPSPSWNESHVDRNRFHPSDPSNPPPLDGYVQTAAGDATANGFYDVLGHRAMGYFTGTKQLDYYYFMASSFATSDAWFSPLMSRTQPNRLYLYGATSAGHVYPLTNTPPLPNQTIFQLLDNNHISWKIYIHPDSSGCSTPNCLFAFSYLSQFAYGQYVLNNAPNQYAPTTQLMSDIQNGTLPQVAFIEPAGNVGLDEHPATADTLTAANVQAGAAYVASIVNSLMASPSWKDSVFILSFDEAGGFYDHVPPQVAVPPDSQQFPIDLATTDICYGNTSSTVCGFFVTGYRVPLIVISPFTKANYVSHTVMDYTAILKLIETRYNLPSLTARDAAQPDMTEFFDFVNDPWATPPSPPAQPTNLPCVLEALSGITVSPNPAPAGGQATVTLSLSKAAIQNTTVLLSSNPAGVVPPSAVISSGSSSTSFPVSVPTGITSLIVSGSIGGIADSVTVPVQ